MAIDQSVEFDFYRVHQDRKEDYKYLQYGQFIDVNVFQFGREKCKPSHSFGPAVRNHYLFHYILSGRGTLESTDRLGMIQTHQIGPGEGFMIVPQQINTYQADKEEPWEYIWLEFDGACISQPLFAAGLDFDHPVWRPGEDRNKTDMEKTLISMLEAHAESAYALAGYTFLFLDILLRSGGKNASPKTDRIREYYIVNAVNYIEKNYSQDISIENIAEYCGLNRTYFSKIFRESMGVSPRQFLIQYRMTQACSLLKFSNVSVRDIGAAVGYPDQLHFSRAFKEMFHVSPREWRNQNLIT